MARVAILLVPLCSASLCCFSNLRDKRAAKLTCTSKGPNRGTDVLGRCSYIYIYMYQQREGERDRERDSQPSALRKHVPTSMMDIGLQPEVLNHHIPGP